MKLDSGDAASKQCTAGGGGGRGEGVDRWKKEKRAIGFNPIHGVVCLRPQRMRNDPPVPTEFIS